MLTKGPKLSEPGYYITELMHINEIGCNSLYIGPNVFVYICELWGLVP